ncbi:MAG: hypothetical protein D6732_13685 [Methanobacteriota archaeon]|nr:MAG: hypothetical protein D6732_13685 [Euryarchaeota archaeon]
MRSATLCPTSGMQPVYENSFASSHVNAIRQLNSKGIVFISAAGNNSYYYTKLLGFSTRDTFFPQLYPEWFAIGSVDHSGDSRLNPGARSIFIPSSYGSAWGNSVWARVG